MSVNSSTSAQLDNLLDCDQDKLPKDKLSTLSNLLFEMQYCREEVYSARLLKHTVENALHSPKLSICHGVGKIAFSVLGIVAYSPLYAVTFIALAVITRGKESAALNFLFEATYVYFSFGKLIINGYYSCKYPRCDQNFLNTKLNEADKIIEEEIATLKKFKKAALLLNPKDKSLNKKQLKKVQSSVRKIEKVIRSKGSAFDCFKYKLTPD